MYNTIKVKAEVKSTKTNNTCRFHVIHSITIDVNSDIKTEQDALYLLADSFSFAKKIGQPRFYASAHYLILKNGDRVKYEEDENILYHAGKSEYKGISFLNNHSVGYELIHDKNADDPYTSMQIDSLIDLLLEKNVEVEDITMHRIISPDRKVDPVDFDFDEFEAEFLRKKNIEIDLD